MSVSPRLARVSYVLCSILLAACIIIAQLTVPKQHGEVDDVKVGDRCAKATRQTPRPAHHPVAEVVGVTTSAHHPEVSSLRPLDVVMYCSPASLAHGIRAFGITSMTELILLKVRHAEDVIACELNSENR